MFVLDSWIKCRINPSSHPLHSAERKKEITYKRVKPRKSFAPLHSVHVNQPLEVSMAIS